MAFEEIGRTRKFSTRIAIRRRRLIDLPKDAALWTFGLPMSRGEIAAGDAGIS